MSEQSAIEWTDATWNPVRGCVKVSPGCAHCYAETFAERFRGVPGHPYEQGFDLRLVPEKLTEPLSWKKPRRVFVNSMSDLFQDGVPDGYIDHVFTIMGQAKKHTFQVLTKRAERMRAYIAGTRYAREPLPNVWLGVSVENQHFADERIPLLLQTPAAVHFISAEPLLEAVDLRFTPDRLVDWVIVGGESGNGARPFDYRWAQSLVEQCRTAGVYCFVKQMGSKPQLTCADGEVRPMQLRSRKGGDPDEWPEVLRIREFPEAALPPGAEGRHG